VDPGACRFVEGVGLPSRDLAEVPALSKRFADGTQNGIKVPSLEAPGAFEAIPAANGG